MADQTVEVLDEHTHLGFTLDDLHRYSGPHSPAGVALAFQAMRAAFPTLSPDQPPQRREVHVVTPFRGLGARDAFELVTRAPTEGRYVVDVDLLRPERGPTLESFLFTLRYRGRGRTLAVQPGLIGEEFGALVRLSVRAPAEECRLTVLKGELAQSLTALDPAEVFDLEHDPPTHS